jgi:hypothetical protein
VWIRSDKGGKKMSRLVKSSLCLALPALAVLVVAPNIWGQSDSKRKDLSKILERKEAAIAQASEAARKEALAEEILTERETTMGRLYDPSYRERLKTRLVSSFSVEQLEDDSYDLQLVSPAALGDSSADLVYTPVEPCRIIDTRPGVAPITGGTQRDFYVAGDASAREDFAAQGGNATGCGIPFGPATAAVINLTAVGATGPGNLRAFAWDSPAPSPPTASAVNFGVVSGLNAIANGIAIPLCDNSTTMCSYDLIVFASTTVHVVADVVGYYRNVSMNGFTVTNNGGSGTQIGTSCTHDTGATVTINAPVAGKVLVHANVQVYIQHVQGTNDWSRIYIGTSPTDCSLGAGYHHFVDVPAVAPTDADGYYPVVPILGFFNVSAGTQTFYINGQLMAGTTDQYFNWLGMSATFFPN